ncbi:MAG TPA: VapE domain-containing protein, partial [Polyangiaceae bacterium]
MTEPKNPGSKSDLIRVGKRPDGTVGRVSRPILAGNWWSDVRCNAGGAASRHPGNAAIMLCNATEWDGVLSWDAFSRRIYWASEPPQVQTAAIMPKVGAEFTDLDLIYVGHALAMRYGPSFGSEPLLAAVTLAARKRPCHPVKAFLETEPWDGVDRLSTWLTVYLGAVDSPINRSIGRWWLISAVARIYQPGCQADHVVVLEGRQGIGKSRAIACLAADWYLPRLPPINDKDAM